MWAVSVTKSFPMARFYLLTSVKTIYSEWVTYLDSWYIHQSTDSKLFSIQLSIEISIMIWYFLIQLSSNAVFSYVFTRFFLYQPHLITTNTMYESQIRWGPEAANHTTAPLLLVTKDHMSNVIAVSSYQRVVTMDRTRRDLVRLSLYLPVCKRL